MLTKVTAYSQWDTVDPLVWNITDRPETDLFEVRNIEGLGAVKANVNTTPMGSIKGETFTGTSVGRRNIVFTIGLDPDWINWDFSKLRRLLDKTFMPESLIGLKFESPEFPPVIISGYVESNEPNMFSKDPEHQISIICPYPFFKAVDPTVITGRTADGSKPINYQGNVETGIFVDAHKEAIDGAEPMSMGIQIDAPPYGPRIEVVGFSAVAGPRRFSFSSMPGNKYVQSVIPMDGATTNLLNYATITKGWPRIGPGTETFAVFSESGIQDWTLTYYDLFGSL